MYESKNIKPDGSGGYKVKPSAYLEDGIRWLENYKDNREKYTEEQFDRTMTGVILAMKCCKNITDSIGEVTLSKVH